MLNFKPQHDYQKHVAILEQRITKRLQALLHSDNDENPIARAIIKAEIAQDQHELQLLRLFGRINAGGGAA